MYVLCDGLLDACVLSPNERRTGLGIGWDITEAYRLRAVKTLD